jgi:hypothetical protein
MRCSISAAKASVAAIGDRSGTCYAEQLSSIEPPLRVSPSLLFFYCPVSFLVQSVPYVDGNLWTVIVMQVARLVNW